MQPNLRRISPYLRLKVSPRARRMALRLDAKERVVNLVVPRRTNIDHALDFARAHREWINTRVEALAEPIPFEDGQIIPIYGRRVRIDVYYDETLRTTGILLKENRLIVHTNKEDPSGRIARFLKDYAREVLEDLAREKAAAINRTIRSVSVKDTKSRWGSCADDGRLSFSWRLIFAPFEALDYVVAHEVAHLVHMDHSPRFWAKCEELSADYERGKAWIDENGQSLLGYGMGADTVH